MTEIVRTLTNRKESEKTVIFAENYLQSVTSQSLAQSLFGSSLQRVTDVSNPRGREGGREWEREGVERVTDVTSPREELLRGLALHKLIRLISLSMGGEAYLSFLGNEFGHPEWVEFPNSSNEFSYERARRRWDLLEDQQMPFRHLALFDKELMLFEKENRILTADRPKICHVSDQYGVVVFLREKFLFCFNFHPTQSYDEYRIGLPEAGEYMRIFDTDERRFGGLDTLENELISVTTISTRAVERPNLITLNMPSQTAQVFRLVRIWESS